MKKLFSVLYVCCAALALLVCSCTGPSENVKEKVALILPSSTTVSRWAVDASYLTRSLEYYGYDVQLFTADENEDGAQMQVEQLKQAVKSGYKNIVITAIDYAIINESGILEANQNCNFICYDRIIMNNPAVDFFISCDPSKIGEMQAQFLLEKANGEAMTIEYFAGPATDKNASKYFEGAYKLLSANESLSVPSGKQSYNEVALDSWSSEDARVAMDARLRATHTVPDLILAPNDNVANGIIEAIQAYRLGIQVFPIITGQDLTEDAIANIKAGKQAMTIYKENEDMAETTAMVVSCFISGKSVITSQSFNNGSINVPAKFTNFTLVTSFNIDNYSKN